MKNIYNIKQKNLFTIFINGKILRNFSQTSSNFKKLNDHDIDYFRTFLPFEDVLTNDLDGFNTDWLKKYKGNSSLVLRPKTTSEVSKILKYCNKNKLAIVPQGGNTGLVGGSVPLHDEVVISTKKMNKIIEFDAS